MKESIDELKTEFKAKLDSWQSLKSRKIKVAVIVLCIGIVALKIFTTVLTVDWLSNLFN